MAADLCSASKDEMAGRPFVNPSVGVLRREIKAIRSRVEGMVKHMAFFTL